MTDGDSVLNRGVLNRGVLNRGVLNRGVRNDSVNDGGGSATMTAARRLAQLGLEPPEPLAPDGRYLPAVRIHDLVYLSSTGPVRPDGSLVTGKVGADLGVDAGREAARLNGLRILAMLAAELGDLERASTPRRG